MIKPILFNTEMVRGILEDRKKVTRRIIKYNPEILESPFRKQHPEVPDINIIKKLCIPPYKINDVLYVRETWSEWTDGYVYKAWSEPFPQPGQVSIMKWHPSIHMPKEAARIFLKVKDVRIERLQEITEEQAQAEGCSSGLLTGPCTARGQFENLWNSTIKKSVLDTYGWCANPWVWCYSSHYLLPTTRKFFILKEGTE